MLGRTAYTKNVAGSASDYGVTEHLGYTFGVLNDLTAISNSTDPRYSCAVTCDANNNITELDEKMTGVGAIPPFQDNFLYTYFEYDALNRMTKHKTKAYQSTGTAGWYWTERQYEYSAVGALLRTGWRHYLDGGLAPAYARAQQAYDQQTGNLAQSVAVGHGSYGTRWVWAGAQNGGYGNLFGPNSDTASQNAYTLNAQGGAGIPNRRTFINPSTQGDKRELWGQGRPMGKDSNTAWSTGTVSAAQNINQNPVTSRLMFEGTVTSTDLSRITDMREKGRIGIYGTGLSYAGASPRVTSESIGRDLNPLGRGDGNAYVGGGQNAGFSAQNLGTIYPALPLSPADSGSGNSSNNPLGTLALGLLGAIQLPWLRPGFPWGGRHKPKHSPPGLPTRPSLPIPGLPWPPPAPHFPQLPVLPRWGTGHLHPATPVGITPGFLADAGCCPPDPRANPGNRPKPPADPPPSDKPTAKPKQPKPAPAPHHHHTLPATPPPEPAKPEPKPVEPPPKHESKHKRHKHSGHQGQTKPKEHSGGTTPSQPGFGDLHEKEWEWDKKHPHGPSILPATPPRHTTPAEDWDHLSISEKVFIDLFGGGQEKFESSQFYIIRHGYPPPPRILPAPDPTKEYEHEPPDEEGGGIDIPLPGE